MAAASTAPARRASTAPARTARPTTRPASRSRASAALRQRSYETRAAPRGRARPARRTALTPTPPRLVPLAVGMHRGSPLAPGPARIPAWSTA